MGKGYLRSVYALPGISLPSASVCIMRVLGEVAAALNLADKQLA